METYNYKLVHEKDYQGADGIDLARLHKDLEVFGDAGFRFIETLYNSDGTWLLLLSCPKNLGYSKDFQDNRGRPRYNNRDRNDSLNRF